MFHTEITEDTELEEKGAGVLLIFYLRGLCDLRELSSSGSAHANFFSVISVTSV